MIELRSVGKVLSSGGRPLIILHPLTLTIPAGQFVAVMGPSGSGKSTLLGLLAGLDEVSQGEIRVDGHEITALNEDQLARFRGKSIGFVFQSFQLIPTLTAAENIRVPMEIMGNRGAAVRAGELLEMVGLAERASHYPAQLSGGEQQRVAIARAFACGPKVLLADEPTGNLDSETGGRIIELLKSLNREEKTTLVLVTHDPEIAAAAQRIVTLRDGRIVADEPRRAAGRARKAGS